ncbi:MAG: hypothetical protein HY909_30355 [Deltaproteobacteria bacterium]|nr:hypothetical protein [Deltaproteobacteria bacterium]
MVQAPQAPQAPPGRGARVVVDVSESVRGFTSTSSVALETLHGQVIDGALSAMQLNNPFERCALDTDLHCAPPFVTPQQLRLPGTYRGTNAALHLALRRPPRAPRPDLQVPDPLDPFAVTVLVTDGFQSTSSAFQPNAVADVACTAGADPSCLAALLRRRVDEGYGVWVLRLTLPFEGRYFAERRLDATMWARVTAHVEELNRDPAWNGVRFSASRPTMTSDSGPFQWSGARPLLVFVLSRDIPRARGLLTEMVRRLNVERIGRRQTSEDFTWAEWAPYEGLTAQVVAASRADRGPQADALRVDPASRTPGGFVVPARCSIQGKSRILLQGAVAYGSQTPPPWARIELGWRLLTPPAGELLVPREALRPVPGAFQAYTGLDCTVLNAGRYSYDLALWARWSVDDAALAQQWFSRESADTSFETPERVFGLADLARSVVSAGVTREGALDRVALRLNRD